MCSLMKIKHLILLTTTAVAASSLSSCKEEPYFITAEEEYTRNFIKEFGLIDPNQDWNLAEGSTVTVKVGNTPAEVKAYMKVDQTYYLMADLKDVAGDVKIPFDMPEGTKDIMVKINGTRYYTTPGGTVDPANPTSRGLLNEGTNTFADVEVTVEENPHGRVLTLTPETMDEAIDFLPESEADNIKSFDETNLGKVTDNFFVRAKEFYIFPEYWKTDSYSGNKIGIYWYVDAETEGATHIKRYSHGYWGDTEVDKWIMKVPFFNNPQDFLTPYNENGEVLDYSNNSALVSSAAYYESKGVHVVLDREMDFGFYIENDPNVMYSESILNFQKNFNDVWYYPSYVATFLNGTDTEGNDKRHLCFEDWYLDNWDLNDMVFRVYGFDNIADGSMETGKVTDKDRPNNDPDDPTPPTPEVDEPYQWLLAVEDLGATDDFDFNDIIIGISSETINTLPDGARTDREATQYREVTFTALAAGGTLPAFVYYNDIPLYPNNYEGNEAVEWHKWFGDGYLSSGTMINTGSPIGKDNQKGKTCTLYFADDENFPFSVAKLGKGAKGGSGLKIKIVKTDDDVVYSVSDTEIGGESYFIQPSEAGSAPQMFLIPDAGYTGGWKWPIERSPIQTSYKNFGEWVKGASNAPEWYKDQKPTQVCRPIPSK